MEKMIGYCGINCSDCPVLIETHKGEVTEEDWIKFGRKPEEIHCDGCLSSSGRLQDFCNNCEVRLCAMERKVENCAICPEYSSCQTLSRFVANFATNQMVIEANETLNKIRRERGLK